MQELQFRELPVDLLTKESSLQYLDITHRDVRCQGSVYLLWWEWYGLRRNPVNGRNSQIHRHSSPEPSPSLSGVRNNCPSPHTWEYTSLHNFIAEARPCLSDYEYKMQILWATQLAEQVNWFSMLLNTGQYISTIVNNVMFWPVMSYLGKVYERSLTVNKGLVLTPKGGQGGWLEYLCTGFVAQVQPTVWTGIENLSEGRPLARCPRHPPARHQLDTRSLS